MKVNYQYASPSTCLNDGLQSTLGFSPDLAREEKVSFLGKLKHPLIFRDAMLMLRQIVMSDASIQTKERPEFFTWLNAEIERRILIHEQYQPDIQEALLDDMNALKEEMANKDKELETLYELRRSLQKELDSYDAWKDYYELERKFWKFIKERDSNLWFVLDPVITVHPDIVSFEAFSVDESIYGNLSIKMDEFEMLKAPQLGTTNIDFSAKLAEEMERLRSYNEVTLSVNPEGFVVDTDVLPERLEKKIDLPESWIKGFNQVSSAATLPGVSLELSPMDIYDICSFLKRHKEKESPRYMKWILNPNEPVKILFAPFNKILTLQTIYTGTKPREEKIWGRRRWLILENLIPLAKSFTVKLHGFGMPQFIIADLGCMTMTVGFSSWSRNDWVKGTSFNVMAGFIGDGNYPKVYDLLKEHRQLTLEEIYKLIPKDTKTITKSGVGSLMKRGEGYFDAVTNQIRFRQLCNTPIPSHLYETTDIEHQVAKHLKEGMDQFSAEMNEVGEFIFTHHYNVPNPNYQSWYYRNQPEEYNRRFNLSNTSLNIDPDGNITTVKCNCSKFLSGARNISAPCAHILALYSSSTKFLKLELEVGRAYKINDIMETLL